MTDSIRTFADLVQPYKSAALAEVTGVSRQAVSKWRMGHALPEVALLPALADLLRVDLGDLTRIVAEDTKRRNAASDSRTAGAA